MIRIGSIGVNVSPTALLSDLASVATEVYGFCCTIFVTSKSFGPYDNFFFILTGNKIFGGDYAIRI